MADASGVIGDVFCHHLCLWLSRYRVLNVFGEEVSAKVEPVTATPRIQILVSLVTSGLFHVHLIWNIISHNYQEVIYSHTSESQVKFHWFIASFKIICSGVLPIQPPAKDMAPRDLVSILQDYLLYYVSQKIIFSVSPGTFCGPPPSCK